MEKCCDLPYWGVVFDPTENHLGLIRCQLNGFISSTQNLECFSLAPWLAVILQQLQSTLNLMMRSFKTEKVKMEVSKPSAASSLLAYSCDWRARVGNNGIMLQPIIVHFASASRQHQKKKLQHLSLLIMSYFKI